MDAATKLADERFVLRHLGKKLRAESIETANEALPERWKELILRFCDSHETGGPADERKHGR
jgi:hypothetical protein